MVERTSFSVEEENEIGRARALQHMRNVTQAFVDLFGPPGKRTPQGTIVLGELERFCGNRKLINELDDTGATDIYRTARKHGRCDVMQAIHDAIEWKESDHARDSSPSPR